jgi:hypothetical protein
LLVPAGGLVETDGEALDAEALDAASPAEPHSGTCPNCKTTTGGTHYETKEFPIVSPHDAAALYDAAAPGDAAALGDADALTPTAASTRETWPEAAPTPTPTRKSILHKKK